ncbi:MAG: hypothetical protein HYU53_04315 [Acidobacteria bacterium]|nr:hypothetical protein [Acidobacteriota bacterium]
MKYSTPELVVVGTAAVLVQGIPGGVLDSGATNMSRPAEGIGLGLDE